MKRRNISMGSHKTKHRAKTLHGELRVEWDQWLQELEKRRTHGGSDAPVAFHPSKPIPLGEPHHDSDFHRLHQLTQHAVKKDQPRHPETPAYLISNRPS